MGFAVHDTQSLNPMVFIALAAAPTFSARPGTTNTIDKRIAVSLFSQAVGITIFPSFYAVNLQICNKNH
jgi:hypothetical protein